MLSVLNNLAAGPYELFQNQEVTGLSYSRLKKSVLGCCSDGGTVALYDTHANKLLHSFPSAHSCPVAAISFSPVNDLLMVSVGYDKQLSCFNAQTKQPVMSHRSSAPLTSIAFLGLGQLVALGTMTGQVLIHDMRTINTPLATLKAHQTAVTNILLQPSPTSKSVSSSSRTGQRNTMTHSLTKSCSEQPNEILPALRAKPESPPEAAALHDLSVFSPIRDTNLPTETSKGNGLDNLPFIPLYEPMKNDFPQSFFSPVRTTDLQHSHYSPSAYDMDINEDNLLSPIRDTTMITRSDSDSSNFESPHPHLKSPLSKDTSLTTPTGVPDKENIEPSAAGTKKRSSTIQPADDNATLPTTNTPSRIDEKSKGIHSSICTSPAPQLNKSFTRSSQLSPSKKGQLATSVPTSDPDPETPPTQEIAGAGAGAVVPVPVPCTSDMPAASHGVPQLQMELVRSCMMDVLEVFQDDINSRLMHLQYLIIKKSIEQEEVTERLVRQYSVNEEVLRDNERLRQEIAKLQAKY